MSEISIRSATNSDVQELASLLNEIVAIGGTTAREKLISEAGFSQHYLDDKECVDCLVAQDDQGRLLGFQALRTKSTLDEGWIDIATFARVEPKVKGVGRALLERTQVVLKALGYTHINATIRADNKPGLGYYSKMGFTDYARNKDVPLLDGTKVDRVSKMFKLEQ